LPTNNLSKDVTTMFKIDTDPDQKSKLDPKRFKKGAMRPMAKIDEIKVNKMLRYGIPE